MSDSLRSLLNAHKAIADEGRRRCIEACFECAEVCAACADACLSEENAVELKRCIRRNLDCATICRATGDVALRQSETDLDVLSAQLKSCIRACQHCRIECEGHDLEHCRLCAASCHRCEEACQAMVLEFEPAGLERPEHYSG